MKQNPAGTRPILTDALHSLAVAIAIVFLGHFLIWLAVPAASDVMTLDDAPAPVEDQADRPPSSDISPAAIP
jgi:hypothetical protein